MSFTSKIWGRGVDDFFFKTGKWLLKLGMIAMSSDFYQVCLGIPVPIAEQYTIVYEVGLSLKADSLCKSWGLFCI